MLDLLIFSVFVLLMFLTPLLGIIKYEGLHGIIYRVENTSQSNKKNANIKPADAMLIFIKNLSSFL